MLCFADSYAGWEGCAFGDSLGVSIEFVVRLLDQPLTALGIVISPVGRVTYDVSFLFSSPEPAAGSPVAVIVAPLFVVQSYEKYLTVLGQIAAISVELGLAFS